MQTRYGLRILDRNTESFFLAPIIECRMRHLHMTEDNFQGINQLFPIGLIETHRLRLEQNELDALPPKVRNPYGIYFYPHQSQYPRAEDAHQENIISSPQPQDPQTS